MSDLMVIVTENVPPSLSGRLSLLLVEIRSGVYVGMYSSKVRDYLWGTIESGMRRSKGNVIMVWKDRNDAGYSIKSLGKSKWEPCDFDGITLMRYASNINDK